MVEVVNVIGSGSLGVELDLEQISLEIGSSAEYDPDKYPGVYLRLDEEAPLITFYRTGKYITTGAASEEGTYEVRQRFLELLHETGVINEAEDDWFHIQNIVCIGEIGQKLNLNALAIGLGLESTEYEPEQFPGLIYRPSGTNSVVLLFTSGRVVITGSPDLDTAERTFAALNEEVMNLLNVN